MVKALYARYNKVFLARFVAIVVISDFTVGYRSCNIIRVLVWHTDGPIIVLGCRGIDCVDLIVAVGQCGVIVIDGAEAAVHLECERLRRGEYALAAGHRLEGYCHVHVLYESEGIVEHGLVHHSVHTEFFVAVCLVFLMDKGTRSHDERLLRGVVFPCFLKVGNDSLQRIVTALIAAYAPGCRVEAVEQEVAVLRAPQPQLRWK